ncbi:MAG: IS3 family transposase [Acidobacteriota bacterium]|nr:IS3 family transposase [Acidobacteriota bacterium]
MIAAHLTTDPTASVRALCASAGVSRAAFYRWRAAPAAQDDASTEVRDAVQRVSLEMPMYGYRRVTAELRRRGHRVNHKRVHRLMRDDNLLCLRRRAWVRTTDSEHTLPIYPNLVRNTVVTATDRLWIADITYIRLGREFIYLAVVLDALSRRVIGWALERYMDAGLTLAALRMALSSRSVAPGMVHHSDRGVQYAAAEYTELLVAHGIRVSMSRRANPYDNAQCERFMRTLKYEEVYMSDYDTLAEARSSVGRFIEDVYNEKRLHSALGYVPPAEFERSLVTSTRA